MTLCRVWHRIKRARREAFRQSSETRHLHISLVPFPLAHVGIHRNLMQADGLHPNARGEPRIWIMCCPSLLHYCHTPVFKDKL